MSKNVFNNTRLHMCVDAAVKLDDAQAEVAFAGRSNVGKSSLINALCGRNALAKISKVPGKTRTVNAFSVCFGKWLVDLPGYGYAAVSREQKNSWKYMIEDYFFNRPMLKAIFVLVDAYLGATVLDRQMLVWLKSVGIPYYVIINKIDRVGQMALDKQRQSLSLDLEVAPERILWVSAKKSTGIEELRGIVSGLLTLS
jgi:GTP-binding protein